MKKQHENTPNIDNKPRKGLKSKRRVPGAVCDHIRLCPLFEEGDEEAKLRQYAVGE